MKPFMKSLAAMTLALATLSGLQAHTTVKSSNPPSGSVLTASPPVFEVVFAERVKLTSLLLVNKAGERKLAFKPTASALKFSSAKPGLALGRNEIRWTALAQDGHVIKGSIIIVLRAPKR